MKVFAPSAKYLCVEVSEKINPFDIALKAIGIYESKGDILAYNPLEEACGIYQIRPIRLLDYNQRTGKNYQQQDLFREDISREIFMYYAQRIGPYEIDKAIKQWNGSGPATEVYLNEIKGIINWK